MKYLILCASILLFSSFAFADAPDPHYYSQISTGSIGCPPEEIQTYNIKLQNNYQATWMAQCNGKIYYCSGFWNYINQSESSVSCALAQTQ
jgi:hypothetical protein